jgi:hypothetical protein
MLFIDRFTVVVKDACSKRVKRLRVDADDVYQAHKSALSEYNELTQDVIKILDAEGNVAYTLENGFVY